MTAVCPPLEKAVAGRPNRNHYSVNTELLINAILARFPSGDDANRFGDRPQEWARASTVSDSNRTGIVAHTIRLGGT
jgi:hypothetical protein